MAAPTDVFVLSLDDVLICKTDVQVLRGRLAHSLVRRTSCAGDQQTFSTYLNEG